MCTRIRKAHTHTQKFQKCHVQIWWHASREIFLMQEMRWKMWMRRWDYQHWLGGTCFFLNLIFMQWLIWGAAEAIGQPSSSETCGQKGSIKPGMLKRMNLHWTWEKSRVPVTSQKQIISGQWFCVFFWFFDADFRGFLARCSQCLSPGFTRILDESRFFAAEWSLAGLHQVFEGFFETIDSQTVKGVNSLHTGLCARCVGGVILQIY